MESEKLTRKEQLEFIESVFNKYFKKIKKALAKKDLEFISTVKKQDKGLSSVLYSDIIVADKTYLKPLSSYSEGGDQYLGLESEGKLLVSTPGTEYNKTYFQL